MSGETNEEEIEKRVDRAIEDMKKEDKKLDEYIEENKRDMKDLLIYESFLIDEVLCINRSTVIRPDLMNTPIGPPISTQDGGYITHLELKVNPLHFKELPIKTLHFRGNSGVRRGDLISVLIPKYEEKVKSFGSLNDPNCMTSRAFGGLTSQKRYFFERPYHDEENAIEIQTLDSNENILRIDRSIDFGRYVKD